MFFDPSVSDVRQNYAKSLGFFLKVVPLESDPNGTISYGIDPNPGGDAVIKMSPEDGGRSAVERADNVGVARILQPDGTVEPLSKNFFSGQEGSPLMRAANAVPTMNSMAGLHDTFMGTVESIIGKNIASTVVSLATIIPAMAVNTVATLSLMPEASGYVASHSSY